MTFETQTLIVTPRGVRLVRAAIGWQRTPARLDASSIQARSMCRRLDQRRAKLAARVAWRTTSGSVGGRRARATRRSTAATSNQVVRGWVFIVVHAPQAQRPQRPLKLTRSALTAPALTTVARLSAPATYTPSFLSWPARKSSFEWEGGISTSR